MSYQDQEYHRRRSEMELEQAVLADDPQSAVAHLELARMHRAKRAIVTQNNGHDLVGRNATGVFRTDKEA